MWEKIKITILFIILFFIRIPSVYLLPIKLQFFTSHFFIKIAILFSVLILILKVKGRIYFKYYRKFLPIHFFLITQSLSIIDTVNLRNFFLVYEDVVFSILGYFVILSFVDKKNIKLVIDFIILATTINLLLNGFIYFFPNYLPYITEFVYSKSQQIFLYQYKRRRFFGDSFDELIIPFFLIYLLLHKKKVHYFFSFTSLIFMTVFFSVISNWRTKALITIFVFFTSIFLSFKKFKFISSLLIFLFLVVVFISHKFSLGYSNSNNVIIRLLFNQREESKSIKTRFFYWKEAYNIGLSHPFFGVGLGNYYDNLSQKSKEENKNTYVDRYRSFIVIDDPHNVFLSIFATSGFLGLISFLILILHFLISDFKTIFYKKEFFLGKLIITSFWGLFLYGLFNPCFYFSYVMFFWILRGLIEKINLLPKINY